LSISLHLFAEELEALSGLMNEKQRQLRRVAAEDFMRSLEQLEDLLIEETVATPAPQPITHPSPAKKNGERTEDLEEVMSELEHLIEDAETPTAD
jgi:hypothetical protein